MRTPEIERLGDIFRKYQDIQAVYLFGSTAEGSHLHAGSDLDLAILPRTSKLRARTLNILTDLAQDGFCNVDLVFLDTDDIVLKFEVVKRNRVIYASIDFDPGSYYSKILRQYLDFLPYLEVQREAYKRSILSG